MLTQFNSSTWREDNITIESGEVFDLNFIDTKPNMFYVQNPNNDELKISISSIPNKKSYEFVVHSNSSEPIGRPTGTGHLYILNIGTTTAKVKVYSIADKFDMNILKNFVVSLSGVTVEAQQEIKFAEGVALPSGTNNIGVVSLKESLENDITNMGEKVNAIADNSAKINSLDTTLKGMTDHVSLVDDIKTANEAIKKGIEKIANEGIGAQINGNVYISADTFYKEETVSENVYGFVQKSATTINSVEPLKTEFYFPFTKDTSDTTTGYKAIKSTGFTTFFWFTGNTGKIQTVTGKSYSLTSPEIGNVKTKEYNGIHYFCISDIFRFFIMHEFFTESDIVNLTHGSSNFNYIDYVITGTKSHKEISGILHDLHRIKNFFTDGLFQFVSRNDAVIFGNGKEKIMDEIISISTVAGHGRLKAEIYIDSDHAVVLNFDYEHPINNLKIPVYKIIIRGGYDVALGNKDETAPESQLFNILGGLY